MCIGCGIPGCGGACGTDDWDQDIKVTKELECSDCSEYFEFEGIATIQSSESSFTPKAVVEAICPACSKVEKYEISIDNFDDSDYDYWDEDEMHYADLD
jgi:hypothetical protein